ncbi:Uncharacterized conserved protein, DUF983 family [Cognatiyoonia sediminum]|uniref:Uncharacterized conserved protein, DUF983 family n=1 Tax=Cognatiyoonia sediminum TaxID=1508389 RepID=A0A1M5NAA8_9RHOB|nr:DUF983 domain-containing protein [Cognatiyoonia sediminum]SHG86474.1 Uncharacterized conserved protein, DUF983 family [Cognatiyoonia sediminum]
MSDVVEEREMKPAMWRGLKRKCPNCGQGSLFAGYLKTADSCSHCGQDFTAHRADDGPAYLTILVVGHIIGFAMHFIWSAYRPDPLTMALVLTAGSVALSLWLLPRLKGMIIAIQWAKRMHGFGKEA